LLLGDNLLDVASIKIDRQEVISDEVYFQPISPVTAYSTLLKADGSKYTCYFQPGEEDFRGIVEGNLKKKYTAFTGNKPPADSIKIKPMQQPRQHIIKYRDFIIKGYSGKLLINGPRELLQMAADAGLGGKNSQGFGCVRME
jgi:CRISPR-associated endoribonuclease Cas6